MVLVWFLHCKGPLFPLSTQRSWKEVTVYSSHARSREYALLPCRQSNRINYLEFFSIDLSLLHILAYSIIYLCQFGLMGIFLLQVIIQQCIIYFVAQIIPTLAIGSSFSWLPCPVACPCLGGFVLFCWAFPTSWHCNRHPGSSWIFPVSVLESATSPRNCFFVCLFFNWR